MANDQKVVISSQGIGFCGLLFIVLLLLKVGVVETTVIGWSWWWITSPLWGPVCLVFGGTITFLVIVLVMFFCGLICKVIISQYEKRKERNKEKE